MGIIGIENTLSALFKQQALTVDIICQILMLVWSDMIRLQIRKDTIVKHKAADSVQHQSLAGHLHDNTFTAGIHHLPEGFLHHIRLRCSIGRRDLFLSDDRLDRTDQTCLIAGMLKNGTYHIGRCCLSLGAGDTDRCQLSCRMSEKCCRGLCQCQSCILHTDHCHILCHIHVPLHNQHRAAVLCYLRRKIVSVSYRTTDADKNSSRCCFSGIIDQRRDFLLYISLYKLIVYILQQCF